MKNLADRAIEILEFEGITNPVLERKTGIKQENWKSVRYRRTRFNQEHIEAIGKLWPKYVYWLVTGKTIKEVNQIKPGDSDEDYPYSIEEIRNFIEELKKKER